MAKLTCTQKSWDNARPSSVKKTGLGDAITKALKALPGGDTEKLGSLDDCDKARPHLVALQDTLKSALAAVSKAKDDKKDAAALLKGWQSETDDVLKALNARQFTLIEDIVVPVHKKWEKPREEMERKVQEMITEIRAADQNMGHAEQMLQQAVFAMIQRAGELKEQGAVDSLDPTDYLIDKDFKAAYKAWRDMVELGLKNTRRLEAVIPLSKNLTKLIQMMRDEVVDAEKRAGKGLQLDSPALRKFNTFCAGVKHFYNESATDGAAKYATFRFIADPSPGSAGYEDAQVKGLQREFGRLSKVDADRFFETQMAKYGLNESRLKKTLQAVKAAEQRAQKLKLAAQQEGANKEELANELTALARTLDETHQRLYKARNNMEVIQALSKEVNADMKLTIDQSIAYVERVAKSTVESVEEIG